MANFREHMITDGQTLQMIAQKVLGDASRGLELAVLNDLQYPFIIQRGEEPQEGVRMPGDTILIPIEVEYTVSMEEIDEDLYSKTLGIDLGLSTDRMNLSFSTSGDLSTSLGGDLQVVSGVQTLKQDLIHRLITEIGTMPYHPTYGSKFLQIIGNKKDSTWKQKATIELSKTFKSDPRVVDVTNVFVESFPTGLAISCNIVTAITKFLMEELLQEV